jgi:hypothetical protein
VVRHRLIVGCLRRVYPCGVAKLPEHVATERLRLHLGEDLSAPAAEEAEYGPKVVGKCNAKLNKSSGKRRCRNVAGAGTDHAGYGNCVHHFGATPSASHFSAKARYDSEYADRIRFGQVIDTDPMTGILAEVSRSAGFIAYLQRQISDTGRHSVTGDVQLLMNGPNGEQPTGLVQLWRSERRQFATSCKIASDMGVAEAQIDLLRVMGGLLAELVEQVVSDLGHDPHDPEVERVVATRLQLVAGGSGSGSERGVTGGAG